MRNQHSYSVYRCSVAPRKDADVQAINSCITGLGNHWTSQQVHAVSEYHDFFYKCGHVESRYFSQDGIISHFLVLKGFWTQSTECSPLYITFSKTGTGNLQGNGQFGRGQRSAGFRMQGNNGSRTMFKGQNRVRCSKFGHKIAVQLLVRKIGTRHYCHTNCKRFCQ